MSQGSIAISIVAVGLVIGAGAATGVFVPRTQPATGAVIQPTSRGNVENRAAVKQQPLDTIPNLTNTLIAGFADTITRGNVPGDIMNGGTLKLPNRESLERMLASAVTDELAWDKLTKDKVRVTTFATERRYLEAVDAVTHKNFDGFGKTVFDAIQQFNETGDVALFSELAARAERQAADLINLEVPATLADTHLDLVNLWRWKLAAYRAMAKSGEDPLQAAVAMRTVEVITLEDIRIQGALISRYESILKQTP